MSFKRLMLIISVVVGTVFAGSASSGSDDGQVPGGRAEIEKNYNIMHEATQSMDEDFAVPMHGGDPTMEIHFEAASFTPDGRENTITYTPENTDESMEHRLNILEEKVEQLLQMNDR